MHFLPQHGSGTALDPINPTAIPDPAPKTVDSADSAAETPATVSSPSASFLASAAGATTAQTLIQQVAYLTSDKIFAYDPPSFGLSSAFPAWSAQEAHNVHGYAPVVSNLQTRTGAGAFALGYIFSPDFDPSRRHIPQTVVAPSLALRPLRNSLEQLALLYSVGSPLVAHVAAVEYLESGRGALVADYDAALRTAEDAGLGLVASTSPYEVQHVALLATLMARLLPTLHVYDGVRLARESLLAGAPGALGSDAVAALYRKLVDSVAGFSKHLDDAGKVLELFDLLNSELNTSYRPFEYHGHEDAESVLVVFGSAEAQIAKQVVSQLAQDGAKIGVVNVRLYRPFVEDEFFKVLPRSTKKIGVLGQVKDDIAVSDGAVQSALYGDVLLASSFGDSWARSLAVSEVKYASTTILTPSFVAGVLGDVSGVVNQQETFTSLPALGQTQQYVFWDLDESATANSPTTIAQSLSSSSATEQSVGSHIYVHSQYDNLVQGGIVRTDLRASQGSVDAPYPVEEAEVVAVGSEKLLKEVALLDSVKNGGALLLRLSSFKDEDAEKRLPAEFRKAVVGKGVRLHVLDTSYSPSFETNPQAAKLLFEMAFYTVARPGLLTENLIKLVNVEAGSSTSLQEAADALGLCLRQLDVPKTWAEQAAGDETSPPSLLPPVLVPNSFEPYPKEGPSEDTVTLGTWEEAAKGIVFKEAYGTQTTLRPDLPVKTATVHVKENRRLTPDAYDRNIFHIEFDLGDTGLTYDIGEALGIHAENDEREVAEFEQFYGLDPDAVVHVRAREDPETFVETRTVRQALVQHVDLFGKPPKRFYEALAPYATDDKERARLEALGGKEGAEEFKRRAEVDMVTYADVLAEFPSAHPPLQDLVRIVSPLKRREYSIASAQSVTPNSVALMIVVVNWVDPRGRTRLGQATRYLSQLQPGAAVTVSVKPSVMKLPTLDTAPLVLAGLGTGLAPFRAFAQHRALQRSRGIETGPILLYLGSRHQREEYLYGEEWEAYLASGVVSLLGAAFSRDQPQKIYIQDRMRETLPQIVDAYIKQGGSFYLCGPTWPVPDVTDVLKEAIVAEAAVRAAADESGIGGRIDAGREIERLKDEGRYVLEVY